MQRALAAVDRVAALNPGVSVKALEWKDKEKFDISLLETVDMVILCEGTDLEMIVRGSMCLCYVCLEDLLIFFAMIYLDNT
jgi:hypothetical protein